MGRTRNENGVTIPLTDEEEAIADAKDLAWANNAGKRDAMREIRRLEDQVTNRRIREMTSQSGKNWMDAQEALIATERSKL